MKIRPCLSFLLFVLFLLCTRHVAAQNTPGGATINNLKNDAPLVATASMGNYAISPGASFVVPITVANWNNIIAITLSVRFKQGTLIFNGISGGPAGMLVGPLHPDSTLYLGWNSLTPTTFNGTLVNLNFTYSGPGFSTLKFNLPSCEVVVSGNQIIYVEYSPGSVTDLATNPSHGSIINVGDVIPGSAVTVPVQYTGFTSNAGTLVQKIHYDQSKLTFSGISATGTLSGATASAANSIITINWANAGGADINYPPTEIGLNFTYTGTTATTLDFYPGCLIKTIGAVNIPVSYISGTITPGVVPVITCPGIPTVTYGGQTYNTILIGTQCWLRENLNIGTRISGSSNQTDNGVIEKYCYGNIDANCDVYGGLYQWNEMMQYSTNPGVQGICPTGWHIPTDDEFSFLTTFLGGEIVAGGKMKETGASHWTTPNTGASNLSGFTALPGGFNNSTGGFSQIHDNGYFYTSTEHASLNAWRRGMIYNGADVSRTTNTKSSGFSVRCLKDTCTSYSSVSVSIGVNANPVCAGTTATFTATPVNGGLSPAYQWKVNGINAGTNSAVYNYIPADNDIVTCILTSSFPSTCYSGNPATSNPVIMTVTPAVDVSISVVADATTVCTGTLVTYTATPVNGGSHPVYQWKVSGTNTGTNNPVYAYIPANGDVVTCELTSDITCPAVNPALSNPVTMTVNPNLPVAVTIAASATISCPGDLVTFTATPANGGTAPTFQWKVNGTDVGTNSPLYAYTPANNDFISCVMTSNAPCAAGNPAISNELNLTVSSTLPASVTITPTANPVCSGSLAFFIANPVNGGATPFYQWKLNGTNVGTNDPYYFTIPENGDVVSCIMTSSFSCATGNPATSNSVAMTVNPRPLPVISGEALVMAGNTGVNYTTQAGMTGYTWTVSSGGMITDGSGTSAISVTWNLPGPQTVGVNYLNLNNCNSLVPTLFEVTVFPTFIAGSIAASQTINYNTVPEPLSGVAPTGGNIPYSYQWQISADGANFTDISGATELNYAPAALTVTTWYRQIQTSANNFGSAVTNILKITVNPDVPSDLLVQGETVASGQSNCYNATQTITVAGGGTIFVVQNNGNAHMIAGQRISFRTGTRVEPGGSLHGYIDADGPWCVGKAPSIVTNITGTVERPLNELSTDFAAYPNPTKGFFTLELKGETQEGKVQVTVYGILGEIVLSEELTNMQKHEFSLAGKPEGIYFVSVRTGKTFKTMKIVKQN